MEAAHYAAIWEPKIKRYYQRKAAKTLSVGHGVVSVVRIVM